MTFTYDDNTFSDLVKEVYGTRSPAREYGHLFHYYNTTPENKQVLWDDLCNELEVQMAEDKIRKAEQVAAFEARIHETIVLGAGNRETALRWILQSDGISFDDPGYACYLLNIPYTYEDEFRSMI